MKRRLTDTPRTATTRLRPGIHLLFGVLLCLAGVPRLPASGPAAPVPAPPSPAHLAAAPIDLGQGLTYVRLHRLPEDLPALESAWSAQALVVDIRYPAGHLDPAGSPRLTARPRAHPLFVLVGPSTPAALVEELRKAAPALVTLGLAGPGAGTDIVLDVTPADDRRGYDALDAGKPVDALVGEKERGPRFDEAVLAREHENADARDAGPPEPPAAQPAGPPAAQGAAAPAATAAEPAIRDLVLERAIQLHRTLLALGMIRPR